MRGKVVLVDFWATWCLPCMAQLPHTVELADRFRDRGLTVATVSLDEPENIEQVRRGAGGEAGCSVDELFMSGRRITAIDRGFRHRGRSHPALQVVRSSGSAASNFRD